MKKQAPYLFCPVWQNIIYGNTIRQAFLYSLCSCSIKKADGYYRLPFAEVDISDKSYLLFFDKFQYLRRPATGITDEIHSF